MLIAIIIIIIVPIIIIFTVPIIIIFTVKMKPFLVIYKTFELNTVLQKLKMVIWVGRIILKLTNPLME